MSVSFHNVTKKYGEEYALKEISFTLEKGKIYGLLGPNGSGKSTALKMMAGLVFPSSGELFLAEGDRVTRKISEKVSYLTELDMFYENFTVKQMIDFYSTQFKDFHKGKAFELAETLKLEKHKKIRHYSKGNRGRLKLVLSLARDAELLLLDEPFSGLDPIVRDEIVKNLLSHIDFERQTVVIATHEIDEIEPILDEVIAIYKGNLLGIENVEALREEKGLSVLSWFKQIFNES
ncbi:ABC transporter ATP-binding protein [Falsibacillus pallidus]|uniref:ABC-2 type transport system ATP-binding protein n=1 Tax=Falsibacillus pallidus TaxID=493781 RepID=A0A370GQ63_9BACI|nr:ABC transporter ATP-binding protein [Falsibacillus pallidus]RDI44103.1 ABC-2 type transport system ATP-binding protein [Falsibacillus pallidus]